MKMVQRLALRYYKAKFRFWASISRKLAAEKAFLLFCTPQTRNRKKKIPAVFATGDELHFQMEGIRISGWRFNPSGEKKVMILHGFESTVVNFDRYIKPLVKKGYQVLAFDAPAHGRSGGKQINAPLYKRTIQEVNKRFGPVHSFLAHSFGGLALSLALEELDHSEECRVVLIAPATETTTAIDSFFSFLSLDPSLRKEFDMVIIKKGGVSPSWYSIRRAMKHIRAKVLWVHDEEDEVTPVSDVLQVQSDNPNNIEFMITKGLGHRRIYRDNKVLRSVVEFL